ncbi:MAG: ribosomal protein S18-alanine N-acetyltransferase [Chloroflexi bacterium]|nr:ribosomal protein S18-alanine N-acetyltransferase [Chloroflexota bacterium]
MRYRVEPMRVEHIPVVSAIEKRCYTQPWPINAYRREIQSNKMAHYFVVRWLDDDTPPDAGEPQQTPTAVENGLLDRLARIFRGPSETPPSPAIEAELKSIVGYAGLWLMTDEAHVTTIAVDPEYQGRGLGELLLLGLIDRAQQIGARWLTLEVRVSNHVAQALYEKYTFKEMGLRRRYYSDNGEDALVMWTDPIESDTFQDAVRRNRSALARKLGAA